ncbi:MAG: hypothetical protein COW30_04045 [Rhodospirillales bacterium CG15_BIG_FIL_POST_REV_8_21_14_020_66_15]|nr:MAG: hypothetical protein COW30_04045 [Rhodospirillales bacterium CG15_BIG_FIL_POST_REV_8_21_14_020_66_15]
MSTGDENPLGRWSRLKQKRARGEPVEESDGPVPRTGRGAAAPAARAGAVPPESVAATPPVGAADTDPEARALTEEEAAYVETLPPVEELTSDSDFAAFLDKRVPEFLRRQALRKLWLSDPAFGFIDGMQEYGEDYSMLAQLAAGATSYRPDQGGYGWRDKPKPEHAEAAETEDPAAGRGDADLPGAAKTEAEGDAQETVADKARRVQDRGGSSVTQPTYTPNPYYQAPGRRYPAPESLPGPARPGPSRSEASGEEAAADGDGLGEAEDDLA